ncbi:MAG: HD domain-containing phosphohydrolase, partial [Candidatus Bipolaricaulota bacterium]
EKPVRACETHLDVTARKHAESKLRESEVKFRNIFEQTPIEIELYDERGGLSEVNEACREIFGVTDSSQLRQFNLFEDPNLSESAHESLSRGNQVTYKTTFDSKLVKKNDLYETDKEGKIVIQVIASPFMTKKEGPPNGYLVLAQGVTEITASKRLLKKSFIQLAETTSRVLGIRDPYTKKHEQRVADLAREVGRKMGLEDERSLSLYLGGLLHDIGKIVVPETILTKPGQLNGVEWNLIKSHPEVGYTRILKNADFPWPVGEMTLHHHERLDGSGYPHGLEGGELSLEVRILAVVDVVEAMSTRRPYRSARSKEEVTSEIKGGRSIKYDPEVVDILVDMVSEGVISLAE